MSTIPLSAAEVAALRSPEKEQTRLILSLLIKELALNGWIKVYTGTRNPGFSTWIGFAAVALLCMAFNWKLGLILSVLFGIVFLLSTRPKRLMRITEKGARILSNPAEESPLLVNALESVSSAVFRTYGSCTFTEWRTALARSYKNNAEFHQKVVIPVLATKKLVALGPEAQWRRTEAGEAALLETDALLIKGRDLPAKIREKSPSALTLAATLGGLMLLLPDMEGYYKDLAELPRPFDADLDQQQRQREAASDDSGSYYVAGNDGENRSGDDDPEIDHEYDFGLNSDFLDGQIGGDGGGLDTSGGCGGDGGSGGDGGGCGGGGCGGGCGS